MQPVYKGATLRAVSICFMSSRIFLESWSVNTLLSGEVKRTAELCHIVLPVGVSPSAVLSYSVQFSLCSPCHPSCHLSAPFTHSSGHLCKEPAPPAREPIIYSLFLSGSLPLHPHRIPLWQLPFSVPLELLQFRCRVLLILARMWLR